MTDADERDGLHARLRAILPGRSAPDATLPIVELRRFVATCERAALDVAHRGRLAAVWAQDEECEAIRRR